MNNERVSVPKEGANQVGKKWLGLAGILVAGNQFGTTFAVTFGSFWVFSFNRGPYPTLYNLYCTLGWTPFLFLVAASVMIQERQPGRRRWITGLVMLAMLVNLFLYSNNLFSDYLIRDRFERPFLLYTQAVNLIVGFLYFLSLFHSKSDVNVPDSSESRQYPFIIIFVRNAIGAGALGVVLSFVFLGIGLLISLI